MKGSLSKEEAETGLPKELGLKSHQACVKRGSAEGESQGQNRNSEKPWPWKIKDKKVLLFFALHSESNIYFHIFFCSCERGDVHKILSEP